MAPQAPARRVKARSILFSKFVREERCLAPPFFQPSPMLFKRNNSSGRFVWCDEAGEVDQCRCVPVSTWVRVQETTVFSGERRSTLFHLRLPA